MLYVEEFYKKTFTADNNVNAYLKACKWLANRVIKYEDETENVMYKVNKVEGSPSYEVVLFVKVDEEQVYEQNCDCCKEAHELFYMKSNKDCCSTCRINPYRERLKHRASIMASHFKKKLIKEGD